MRIHLLVLLKVCRLQCGRTPAAGAPFRQGGITAAGG